MRKALLALFLVIAQFVYAQAGWESGKLNSSMGDNSGIVLVAKTMPVEGETLSQGTGLGIKCTKKDGLEVILSTGLILRSHVRDDTTWIGAVRAMSKNGGATLSPVRIRFDQQKIRTEEWMLGADPSNLFAQKPKRFIDALLKDQVQVLLLEAHPVASDPVVFKFDVRGLAQYKTALHDACGY